MDDFWISIGPFMFGGIIGYTAVTVYFHFWDKK